MAAMEEMGTYKKRRTMFGNDRLPLPQFDFHGPRSTLQRWFSPVAGHLPNDDLVPPTRVTTTLSLAADELDSSCGILFFVTGKLDTYSIGSLHFLFAPINYQASGSAAAIYGIMEGDLAMMHHHEWQAITFL